MLKLKYLFFISFTLSFLLLASCAKVQEPPSPPKNANDPVAQQNAFYFTADEGGSITKIDATSNEVESAITVKGSVHNVQVSPDGKILGATMVPESDEHGSSGSMNMDMNGFALFYDTVSNKLLKKVEVGNHPAHIVFTNDGKFALVTNNEGKNVSVIDTSSYKEIKSIPTGKGPHGFRISKDNKFAYVANLAEDTVSVLDLTNFKEVRKITVGKSPVTTGITSDGKTLLVTVNAENALAIVDLDTGKTEKIPVGKGPAQIFVQYDDKYAFVANQGTEEEPSDTVSKIDLSTREVVATIQTGKGSHGVVTSNDNKLVYVTNMFEDTVSVIDNSQNTVMATVKVGKTPNGITYKP
ncbi:MAG: YncE family protein [Thermincola sp.]|jgi:YVTN family beta-propeller protein|nr:YncE family protein [Thermincola sp.]MDT3704774.1 YncE family protein [Thermincola sp.]